MTDPQPAPPDRLPPGLRRGVRSGSSLVAVLACLLAAGCSGSDGANPGSTPGSAQNPAASAAAPPSSTARPQAAVSPKPAVELGRPAALSPAVTVRVVSTSRARLSAKGPGEIIGPGARVRIRVTNESAKPVDLGALAINAYYGKKRIPASPSSFRIGGQLSGALKARASTTGTYYFRVPSSQFGSLQVEVSSGDSPYLITFVPR